MYSQEFSYRIRYAETDQMGYVYYGNYAKFYEIGRVEALRKLGLTYRELEENGVIMPVLDLKIKYLKPIFYDELITIKTVIDKMPKPAIEFNYEILNQKNEKANTGYTKLIFLSKDTHRPCKPPLQLLEKLESAFKAYDSESFQN